MLNMEQAYRTLRNYVKGVHCLDWDKEAEVVTCVINDNYLEVQVHNDLCYRVTVTDDNTGDELYVKYLDLNQLYNFARKC